MIIQNFGGTELIFTKQQIQAYIDTLGQPRASLLLSDFFNSYRSFLHSTTVKDLYNEEYKKMIGGHPVKELVAGHFPLNIYEWYSYEYLKEKVESESKVLDIGCGEGRFLIALSAKTGCSGTGLDFDKSAIEI
ncbi:MAG: class I SAM-dependent methyltransferase, partial [Sphingobacteriales bacterium]